MNHDFFVATFLKAEFDSARFGNNIHTYLAEHNLSEGLILRPNLEDDLENKLRNNILDSYRFFNQRQELFERFPMDVTWQEEIWTADQILSSVYVEHDYWNELSDNTRSPLIGAQNIKKGKVVYGQSNGPILKFLDYKETISFETMIFAKKINDTKSVIIEGHSRATIYALNPKISPKKLKVLVGYSASMNEWSCF